MKCQLCAQEAVGRCYACGGLYCQGHLGHENCLRCETAIACGDRRADRISRTPIASGGRPGWWRPIPAEDYEPPACYACQGLARHVCRNCHTRYCPEHRGKNNLCAACEKSSWLGLMILLAMAGLIVVLWIVGLVQSYLYQP